ncbi:MAG: tyrosine-type recombinase/integrase [Hyphomicrobiaceae bacterium]
MKAKREHRVPLAPRAIEILPSAKGLKLHETLIFPGPRMQVISDSTFSKYMKDHELPGTPHGFRSTFKVWASESGWRDEVSEAALAHVDKDKVRAAYRRTDYLDERRDMMQAWAEAISPA